MNIGTKNFVDFRGVERLGKDGAIHMRRYFLLAKMLHHYDSVRGVGREDERFLKPRHLAGLYKRAVRRDLKALVKRGFVEARQFPTSAGQKLPQWKYVISEKGREYVYSLRARARVEQKKRGIKQ